MAARLISPLRIRVQSASDVVAARSHVRRLAEAAGLSALDRTGVVAAVSELSRNILVFAHSGEIEMSLVRSGQLRGVRIEASDHGPGIADIALAMQDGYSTCGGLGMGLPGTRRLMDEFSIVSRPAEGTRVTVIKWAH